MKRIEELTHDELIVLTDADVNNFIDIEIAEDGIKPCPVPKEPSLASIGIVASDVFYKLGEILFRNKEDAVKVASMDIYKPQYNWNISYDFKWAEKEIDLKIEEIALYRKEDILRSSGDIKARDSLKTQYSEDKKAYDKYLELTAKWRNHCWAIVSYAREKEYQIKNAVDAFNNYLKIADNDEKIALKFFEKAFKEEPNDIKSSALKRLKIEVVESNAINPGELRKE